MRWPGGVAWPTLALAAELVLLGALSATTGLSAVGWLVGTAVAVAAIFLLASALTRHGMTRVGAANQITLGRTVLNAAVAALVADHLTGLPVYPALLTTMAAVALTLDVVDGPVARRTGQATALGARFDMEADAVLMTVLSVHLASRYGWWILGIGALRYAFVAAARRLPWLATPLPRRPSRRLVAATTGIVLVVTSSEMLPSPAAVALLAICLAGLVVSFTRDVVWLAAHRPATGAAQGCPLDCAHDQ